jgi:hypothetical protein
MPNEDLWMDGRRGRAICPNGGLGAIASGDVFLAIREIALNTRKAALPEDEQQARTQYPVLQFIVSLNNIAGALIIVAGAYVLSVHTDF